MGLNIRELIIKREISISELKGKVLAVDAYNNLYQYLTTIRAADGSVFTDKNGRVTSHLIGLFNRTTSLMEEGIKLVFVFDGKAPDIKKKTWEKRTEIKKEATLKFKEAEAAGELEDMKKFASRVSILTKDMISDAKEVLAALGLPIVQAPSEGEAQTAHIVRKGDAYAAVSQDYDNLIFGCPQLVKNLSITGRRKKTGTLGYQKISPEIISLQEVLNHLQINLDQLIVLAILIGTDYNPGGIKGIGPKTALKLVRESHHFEELFEAVEWNKKYPELEWKVVYDTIKNIPVTDDYTLIWKQLDEKKLMKLLVQEHNFSEEQVIKKIGKLKEKSTEFSQQGLRSFLS